MPGIPLKIGVFGHDYFRSVLQGKLPHFEISVKLRIF
jgi:hypothetical protein